MSDFVIGVLGGMGTQATIHLFQQYAEIFPAEKEWDRPRIIIDNRCTMPSRVRAYLYNEKVEELVDQMSESMKNLQNAGCCKVILDCNTSHLFLPQIFRKYPELESSVVHIINHCVDEVAKAAVSEVFVLGTEGTIESRIYQTALERKGVKVVVPSRDEYYKLRECIEAVKQDSYSDKVMTFFGDLINRYDFCILGCTELPVLYEKYKKIVRCKRVFDPLYIALDHVHKEYLARK